MLIPFVPLKIIQACAVLLKTQRARRMTRLRLLKLLYIADREMLQERARPITGDRAVAVENGPALDETWKMSAGVRSFAWEEHLTVGREIEMLADPGVGKLSKGEIEKLQEVAHRFDDWDDWKLADHTRSFPEWIKNKPQADSPNAIPLDDVLEVAGLTKDKDALLKNARDEQNVDRLLALGDFGNIPVKK